MTTDKLRELGARCQQQARIEQTVKTAQVIEALAGLATLQRKLSR